MFSQIVAAIVSDASEVKSQIVEIAEWLGVEPVDAALLVASIGGLLAYVF